MILTTISHSTHRDETNKNSLPFFANKLDFYSTPLARSRYLPPDGSFFCFESCRIKARFKLIFFLVFAHFFFRGLNEIHTKSVSNYTKLLGINFPRDNLTNEIYILCLLFPLNDNEF